MKPSTASKSLFSYRKANIPVSGIFLATFLSILGTTLQASTSSWNFNFGGSKSCAACNAVSEISPYTPEAGYGFEWSDELKTVEVQNQKGCSSSGMQSANPYVFTTHTGEGNFKITAHFIALEYGKGLTIKTESRRLVVHEPDVELEAGKSLSITFVTNVRNTHLASGGEVKITHREVGAWHWDDALQIEFHTPFALTALEIEKVNELPVVYIMGDSTVTDQTAEPWTGWGQILPYFFDSTIAISNHAESGETLRDFRSENRLEKVMDTLKPGDFVILQFGHNDMKEKGEGIGAMTSYAADLRDFVHQIQEKGAQSILVTSMKRRRFDEQGRQYATLKDYPLAVRMVAAELSVPLVDLNYMSGVFYGAMGPEDSKSAFVHYPAGTFPGQEKALKDDTHFNPYGGYELANCVAEAIKNACPSLAQHLRADIPLYDPSTPHDPTSLRIPDSPRASIEKPAGN